MRGERHNKDIRGAFCRIKPIILIQFLCIPSFLSIVVLSLVCWFVFRQCDDGRVSEAFAAVDPGIRSNFSMYDKLIEDEALNLSFYLEHYQTPKHQQNLAQFASLITEHKAFHSFLDSIRAQLMNAAGLPLDQPIPLTFSQARLDVTKNVLLTGQPNRLSQISEKAARLKAKMLQLSDYDAVLMQSLPLLFNADEYGAYEILNFKGNVCDLPLSGSLALISNLQQLSYASMFGLINYLKNKGTRIICRGFSPFASMNATYVLEGDPYHADVFLSDFFDEKVINQQFWINGKQIQENNGIAHYEVINKQPGKHILDVQYNGEIFRKTDTGHYYMD